MKRVIVAAAALLFVSSADPVGAQQPASSTGATYVNQAAPSLLFPRPLASGMELPLLGLVVSGLLYGAGRVWGR